MFRLFLEKMGAHVITASNGAEGVMVALRGHFDLILMDIQMPKMDGYEATRIFRDNGIKIPIIALTAHAMKDEKNNALNAGFTDFLSKPLNLDNLVATIRHLKNS